jgi:hypothetical protein
VSTVQRRVSGLGVGLKTLRKGWENLGALGKIMEKHHPNVMVFPKKQLNTLWGYTVYHIFRAMMMTNHPMTVPHRSGHLPGAYVFSG